MSRCFLISFGIPFELDAFPKLIPPEVVLVLVSMFDLFLLDLLRVDVKHPA